MPAQPFCSRCKKNPISPNYASLCDKCAEKRLVRQREYEQSVVASTQWNEDPIGDLLTELRLEDL